MKHLIYRASVFLLLAVPFAAQSQEETGTITISVVDAFNGRPFKTISEVSLLSEHQESRRIEIRSTTGSFSNVPYGHYVIQVIGWGSARPQRRHITLNAPEVFVMIGVPFRYGTEVGIGGDRLIVKGRVAGARGSHGSRLWVRLHGVFMHFSREALVDEAGKFEIDGLDMGAYVVEVFDGPKLLHAETLEIDITRHITELSLKIPANPRGSARDRGHELHPER